jgi:hypothetical protein
MNHFSVSLVAKLSAAFDDLRISASVITPSSNTPHDPERRAIFATLPYDVYDQILLHLPDLSTLRAVALCNHRVYEAYTSHRDTIMFAVMSTEMGPALCYARALYAASTDATTAVTDARFVVPQAHFCASIGSAEAKHLSYYGDTAKGLEVYFSSL